jgi:hypothetical protein
VCVLMRAAWYNPVEGGLFDQNGEYGVVEAVRDALETGYLCHRVQ